MSKVTTLSETAVLFSKDGIQVVSGLTVEHVKEDEGSSIEDQYIVSGTPLLAKNIRHDEAANQLISLTVGWVIQL